VWSDSWLNEGVTSYFENRIVEALYGKRRATQEALLSFTEIEDALKKYGSDAPGTALHQPEGAEDAGSGIIYDKGAAFMRTLEHAVGRERFDAWLRQWFDNHAFQPATSQMIYEDMRTRLAANADEADRLKLHQWIFDPGLPDNVYRPDPAAFAEVDASGSAYAAGGPIPVSAWRNWSTAERLRFMGNVPVQRSTAQLGALDSALGLANEGNDEVLFSWLDLALKNRYAPAVPQAEAFLKRVGRAKFVVPLFRTLIEQGAWGKPIAQRIYAETRPGYHAVTRGAVDKVMQGKESGF
jgi:hypothetical protein